MGVLETRPLHTQSRATAALQSARGAGNGRRNKEARRNGEQAEGGEIDKARLVGYVLPRGVGIIAPWAVAANGTGCFALVETADKSRKLNRRHRLSIRVPRARDVSTTTRKRDLFPVSRIRGYTRKSIE